jgi:hypothetical protein
LSEGRTFAPRAEPTNPTHPVLTAYSPRAKQDPAVERKSRKKVEVPIDDNEKLGTAAYRNYLYNEIDQAKRRQPGQDSHRRTPSHRG